MSPSPATRDAGLTSDHAAAAAAATDSLATTGLPAGSPGGGSGGCVVEDAVALGQLLRWFQSVLNFVMSVEAIEAQSGLAKDALRALAQVLHVPSHVVLLVSAHPSVFALLLDTVSAFASRTNHGLATTSTTTGSSTNSSSHGASTAATTAPASNSTLKLKVYDAEALHAALDIFANLVAATSAAAAATAAAIPGTVATSTSAATSIAVAEAAPKNGVVAAGADAEERAQLAALDAASLAVANAADVLRRAAWEAAYACFQVHWRPYVRNQAMSPQVRTGWPAAAIR